MNSNTMQKRILLVCFIILILGSQTLINFAIAETKGNKANSSTTIVFNTEWNQTYGGSGFEWLRSMIQTEDGGFVLAGITGSYGAGSGDFWLVKTDANGQAEWNQTYGGTLDEMATSVVQTADGGYVLTGYTVSYGAGQADIWVVKTDALGQHLWNRTYGGLKYDEPWSIIQTADEGYVIAGDTESYGVGLRDFWLIKTDVNGSTEWNQTFGGVGRDTLWVIIQTADDGYAVAGTSGSYDNAIWIIKTDINGSVEWNQSYDGTETPALLQTAEGGYVFASGFGHTEEFLWLVKTDSNGQVVWNQTLGGTLSHGSPALIQTADGGYAIGAVGSSVWSPLLVKTDVNGQKEWEKVFGGVDSAKAIVQTTDGGYVVAANIGQHPYIDMWLFKVTVSEATAASSPSFGLEILIFNLPLLLFISRKRRR